MLQELDGEPQVVGLLLQHEDLPLHSLFGRGLISLLGHFQSGSCQLDLSLPPRNFRRVERP